MEYYSAVKRNELLIYETTWINPHRSMLNLKKPVPKGYILFKTFFI